ncbi:PREDICTED: transmembrane protein 97-like [Priapulus caudatus]|uniref:Sigma intracellular receptor 2 n=1 Tax=Priapulus caudatus TaxID=37621 RepID=A0ABM1DT59_PRICU|nr:PREDICTED: transmembrane protein 97-like [Priapulus caudatus]
MDGVLDFIFVLYFASHIPVTILIDSQILLPNRLFPETLLDVVNWYSRELKDPAIIERPSWFLSLIGCELAFQLPFFFFALYAFWKGYSKNRWIRIPAIIYSSHVATTLVPIFAHLFFNDFTRSQVAGAGAIAGPETLTEKLILFGIYAPYFVVPMMLLCKMLFETEPLTATYERDRLTKLKNK